METSHPRPQKLDAIDRILLLFVAQIAFLIFLSLMTGRRLIFINHIFQFDFADFYLGARDFVHGLNPFLNPRLDKPPAVLLAGLPFIWLRFIPAGAIFGILNVGITLYALRRFAIHLGLDTLKANKLVLIASLYYPFLFLADRGNLDGLMMALVLLGFCSQSPLKRALALGAATALKLYTGLLLLLPPTKKKLLFTGVAIAAVILLELPFLRYWRDAASLILFRGSHERPWENFGIYTLVRLFLPGLTGKILYVAFWGTTLVLKLLHSDPADEHRWIGLIPWMISMPLEVLPYEGVFLLPMLALFATRESTSTGLAGLFPIGFTFTGFQCLAFACILSPPPEGHIPPITSATEIVNLIGMALIFCSQLPESLRRPQARRGLGAPSQAT